MNNNGDCYGSIVTLLLDDNKTPRRSQNITKNRDFAPAECKGNAHTTHTQNAAAAAATTMSAALLLLPKCNTI